MKARKLPELYTWDWEAMAAAVARLVAEVVDVLHAAGVMHRDLQPDALQRRRRRRGWPS